MSKALLWGAGGSWQVVDECADRTVVKQFHQDACAAACGEILLKNRGVLSWQQQEIARLSGGVPMEVTVLAITLNQISQLPGSWIGGVIGIDGATDEELLDVLHGTGLWAAGFWEDGLPLGHMVVVQGQNDIGQLLIQDPWGINERSRRGARYKMEVEEFLRVWSRQAVYFLGQ